VLFDFLGCECQTSDNFRHQRLHIRYMLQKLFSILKLFATSVAEKKVYL
jgi:hypothetical protein